MTISAQSQHPDHALRENAQQRIHDGTHLVPDAASDALFVQRGTGSLGSGNGALDVQPGAGQVQGAEHTIGSVTAVDIRGGDGGPRRDVVYLDNTGALAVAEGTPAAFAWDDALAEADQTITNAYRPAPPDMDGVVGLPLATVTITANAGTLPAGAIEELRARAPIVSSARRSGEPRIAESASEIQPTIDECYQAGGGDVWVAPGVHLTTETIHVRAGVTLRLPNGCILEPNSTFDMVRLRREGTRQEPGRIVGEGMLRTRPADLEKSTITSFDGAAHIVVDGEDDFRNNDNAKAQNTRLVDGINIWAGTAVDAGYGIHLRCTNDNTKSFIWFQGFRAYIRGCENTIRVEASVDNPDFSGTHASINSNRFDVFAYWPIQAVKEVRSSIQPTAENLMRGNEYWTFSNCDQQTTTLYEIAGHENRVEGFDWDTGRADAIVHFGPGTRNNVVACGRRTDDITAINDGPASNRVIFPFLEPTAGAPIDHDRTNWRHELTDKRYISVDDAARDLTPQLPVMRTFGASVADVSGFSVPSGDAANTEVVPGLETTAGAQVRSPPGYSGAEMQLGFDGFADLTTDGAQLAFWATRGDDIAVADGQVYLRAHDSGGGAVADVRLLHNGNVNVQTPSGTVNVGTYDNAVPQFFRYVFDFTNDAVEVFRNGQSEGTHSFVNAATDVAAFGTHLYDDRNPSVDQPTAIIEDLRSG